MLEPRHFDTNQKSKYPKWETFVKDGKVVQCEKCGKWIIPMWHKDCTPKYNRKTPLLPPMKLCAICFFKKGGDKHG
jgi:hypothetical protein